MSSAVASAYSETGWAWQSGPARIYDQLADVTVATSPVPLSGRLILDVGAGTGAASRAIARARGRPIALDVAIGMLHAGPVHRRPAIVGDGRALPLRDGAVDGTVAACSFNHLDDPVAAFREAARVTQPGGPVIVSALAGDDSHPVKHAVAGALRAVGWQEPQWYRHLRHLRASLGTVDQWAAVAGAAGLGATVRRLRVPFPALDATALVEWRLGLAQIAPFVARLSEAGRSTLVGDALRRLGEGWPSLERSIIVVTAVA